MRYLVDIMRTRVRLRLRFLRFRLLCVVSRIRLRYGHGITVYNSQGLR